MRVAARTRPSVDLHLRRAYEAGQAAFPHLDLPYAEYPLSPSQDAEPRHAEDYFLARACNAALAGAWESLRLRTEQQLRAFLRSRGAAGNDAQQLVEELWGALAEPPPRGGAPTRIGSYDGRGSLRAWLCTILWRRLTDNWRRRSGQQELEPDSAAPVSRRDDPAARSEAEESARLVGRALEAAWPSLTKRELRAVVMKYRYNLPQTEIASLLGVGPPRVTRILASATKRLRAAVEMACRSDPLWDAPGGGWNSLHAALDQLLARADASMSDSSRGERHDG